MTFILYIKISANIQNYGGLEFLRDKGYPLEKNYSCSLVQKKLSEVIWPSISLHE